ncbi:MAG: preprotein translocase subunit SecG [Gemmatimonadetes bacterium]|nr:preprotein translocase subunit SecG [Gemmatimonadota bacterium]
MILGFLIFVHVVVCVALVGVVLLQSGKGGGLAGLGGGGATAVFGGRGATDVLSKLTQGLAIGYMVLSMTIALVGSGVGDQEGSVIERRRADLAVPATEVLQQLQADQIVEDVPAGEALEEAAPAESEKE